VSEHQMPSELIAQLLDDPKGFDERGAAYSLLQEFFQGYPTTALRDLLRHSDIHVRRVAMFIASELGIRARPLLGDVLPLVQDRTRYIAYHAMEVAAVCCVDSDAEGFACVVLSLEQDDEVLRSHAMRLVSRAEVAQLEAARDAIAASRETAQAALHLQGLSMLLSAERTDVDVRRDLASAEPLRRRYAAIEARRRRVGGVDGFASESDPNIRRFWKA